MQHRNPAVRLFSTRLMLGVVALLALVMYAGALTFSAPVSAAPDGKTRYADVIVQYGDHETIVRSITFDTKKITGLEALQLTGLAVVSIDTQFGPAVCSIGGVGMPANDCFGDPQGRYWGYNYWDGTAWQGYQVGAGDSAVKDGAIEGWRWGAFGDAVYPATPVLAANKGLTWLQKKQSNKNGSYGGANSTVDSALSIAANNIIARDWKKNSNAPNLATFLKQNARKYSKVGASSAGKLALGLTSTKVCFQKNTRLPGWYYDAGTGEYQVGAGHQSYAMLGTAAVESVPANAITYLENLQQSDGSFEWQPGWGGDTNSTALAIQALIAAGLPANDATIVEALSYLSLAQNPDGGFPYSSEGDGASDANSTAWVVQALFAAGQDPYDADWTEQANPIDFLQSLQLPNGSFQWQSGSGSANLLATQQAIVALMGRSLVPLYVTAYKECPTP